jgi:hypothetical protein
MVGLQKGYKHKLNKMSFLGKHKNLLGLYDVFNLGYYLHAWESRRSQPNVETVKNLRSFPVEGSGRIFTRYRSLISHITDILSLFLKIGECHAV